MGAWRGSGRGSCRRCQAVVAPRARSCHDLFRIGNGSQARGAVQADSVVYGLLCHLEVKGSQAVAEGLGLSQLPVAVWLIS
jgi:hypothetical protein